MARLNGFAGGLSGKVGSVVFRQRDGQTIATQYQPNVKNPSTDGQQSGRTAFKLMSQLAAIMAPALGAYNTTRTASQKGTLSQRNEFFRKNYDLVTIKKDGDETTAIIPMEKLQLTSSFVDGGTMVVTSDSPTTITIHLYDSNVITKGGGKKKIAIVGFGSLAAADRPARILKVMEVDFNTDGTLKEDIDLSSLIPSEQRANAELTVLAFSMYPTSTAAREKLDNIYTPEKRFHSAVTLSQMVRDGDLELSTTVGQNITLL